MAMKEPEKKPGSPLLGALSAVRVAKGLIRENPSKHAMEISIELTTAERILRKEIDGSYEKVE